MKRLKKPSPAAGRKAVIAVFLLTLCAPVTAVLLGDRVRATAAAVITDPSSWAAQSNALREATPLWDRSVGAYSELMYRLGASPNEGFAVVGRDGWLFLGDAQNANFAQALGRRQLSDAEIDLWYATLAQQQQWLAARGIPMVFVVGPAKWSVYPDKLPAWSDGLRRETNFDRVLDAHPDLPLVDLRPALRDARDTADTYSPLNSHWTDYGAWVGWREIADELATRDPRLADLYVPAVESVRTVDSDNEFASTISLDAENPWTVPTFERELPPYGIVQPDGSLVETSGDVKTGLLDLPRTTRNPAVGNGLTALVLRDSMGDNLSLYLQSAFEETVQVAHSIDFPRNSPNIPALVDQTRPDVVIWEIAERHFNSGLPDHDLWSGANAYDIAGPDPVAAWDAADATAASLDLSGSVSVDPATDLAWTASAGKEQVLRVSFSAQAPGDLVVAPEGAEARSLRYGQGANVLFFLLPQTDGTHEVELSRSPGSGPVTLTSATVRELG